MKEKLIAIILIIIFILGITLIIQATDNTITLQEIAEQINKEDVLENFYLLKETASKEDIKIDISATENTIVITAYTGNGEDKLQTTFKLNGTILASPIIDRSQDMIKTEKFDLYNTQYMIEAVAKLEQIDPEVIYYIWDTGIIDKYSIEDEGIQYSDKMYQIDLSKKLEVLDVRKLNEAMDKFRDEYVQNVLDVSDVSEAITIIWENGNIKIAGQDREYNEVESTTLILENSIITSEAFAFNSSGNMTSKDTFTYFSSLYFIECIGQTIYGYEPNEITNIFTKILKGESEKNYTLEEDGIEVINLGTSEEIQFSLDINKNVKSDNTDTPAIEETNNIIENDTVENEIIENNILTNQEDNTISKDKIPQTGFYINLIVIIAILLIVIITTLVIYKHNKKKNIL